MFLFFPWVLPRLGFWISLVLRSSRLRRVFRGFRYCRASLGVEL